MNGAKIYVALLVTIGMCSFASAQTSKPSPPMARDLQQYRSTNPTHLTRHGPPPKAWENPTPLKLPAGAKEVIYESDGLKLKAWLSDAPDDGQTHPAVVFCHGGFSFGNEDWDVLKPFIDAGFVVMAPRVRAENGNPGDFEYYYGEVDDVIAAGQFLAEQKGVDKQRLFVSGHSAGGDLAALAVMEPNPFALSAPIGAAIDMRYLVKLKDAAHQQLVVFDAGDLHECESRSAMLFTASLRVPIVLIYGDKDNREKPYKQFVALAHHFNKEASIAVVPGTHGESLPNAIPGIIKLFEDYSPPAK